MPPHVFFLSAAAGLLVAAAGAAAEPVILSVSRAGELTWRNTQQTSSVTIEFRTNVAAGSWLPARHVVSPGAVSSATLPPPNPPVVFYRLQATALSNVPAGMILIPEGDFQMGDPYAQGFPNARPAHVVPVSRFFIDRFEVTNEEFRRVFQWAYDHGLVNGSSTSITNTEGDPRELLDLDGNDHGIPVSRVTFTNGVFYIPPGRENHPVTGVTWYGALAYCNYRSDMEGLERCITFTNRIDQWLSDWRCDFTKNGYRLPTEAEWEKAARGGLTGHHFPWESYGGNYAIHLTPAKAYYGNGVENKPVGSYGPNGYGLYDMAGNVWEWVWDYYKADWYSQPEATQRDTPGPPGPWTGTEWLITRVIRGGSVGYHDGIYLLCASRHSRGWGPYYANWVVGFRAARRF